MVTVISGGSHSGRDKVFIDKIKSAVKNGEQVMVIIPDQFSFEYDKKLYEHLGAADFNVIQTAGFRCYHRRSIICTRPYSRSPYA